MSKYPNEIICRGSLLLGTGCGKCSKCEDERKKMSQPITGGVKGLRQYFESEGLAPPRPATATSEMTRLHELSVEQGRCIADLERQLQEAQERNQVYMSALEECTDSKTWHSTYTPYLKERIQEIVFRALTAKDSTAGEPE